MRQEAWKLAAVGLGGFAGANARYLLGGWIQQRMGAGFPYGTLVINIAGCFALGAFATLALRVSWGEQVRLLVGIGFVGAFTTFSTFGYETIELIAEGARYGAAAINVLASVTAGLFATYLGIVAARLLLQGRA